MSIGTHKHTPTCRYTCLHMIHSNKNNDKSVSLKVRRKRERERERRKKVTPEPVTSVSLPGPLFLGHLKALGPEWYFDKGKQL